MADMDQHTVTLVSWDKDAMTAVVKVDSNPDQITVMIPMYDPSFSSSPPSVQDAIAWIKKVASEEIDSKSVLPDLSSLVGGTL